jgi:hypothetical protein
MNIGRIRPDTIARHRSPRRPMSSAPLVLSVVDARTGTLHRVAVETAALHRNSGCYPALCGVELPAASLTTPAADRCRKCVALIQRAGAAPDREPRRPLLQRLRRPGAIR